MPTNNSARRARWASTARRSPTWRTLGQSEPYQTSPRPGHPWHHDKLARQFTSCDIKQANEILDRIGNCKRDAQKFRLRPDGQRVFLTIDVIPTLNPDAVDTLELVKWPRRPGPDV